MKNNKLRYALFGTAACVLMIAAGVVFLWLMDNVFNGALKDFFVSFIIGFDQSGVIVLNDQKLASAAIAGICAFAALLSGTGAICAYRAFARQHALLLRSREETERARTLAEMEMRRKSDLITYLAHDLKTPLASVVAYLSLLEESPELSPELRAKYTGVALDKAYRLDQLIAELFEIIRFNLNTVSLSMESIRLKRMLEQLADEFYPILLPGNKRIRISCPENLTLRGDPDKLARVFNNILKNAAAYADDGTEILVEAESGDAGVALRFANRGEPIPAEKRELIFEKFYRLDSSRSTKTGGAGLGLAIAKQIVEAHGGAISVASDERRTVFAVTLPANPALKPR